MINDDLAIRMNYHGGSVRQDRMIRDKLWSLKTAMRASYHRATAVLSDGREFNCLMNPSKLNLDIDYKEISIPFEDVCLNKERKGKTSEGIEPIDMKCGDIFTWKETDTDWLVYVQRVDELAYFRAGCYKCNVDVEFGEYTQRGHVMGPSVRNIDWRPSENFYWNNINYDAILLLPKTDEVLEYLKRFGKLKINGKQWEVQARNMFTEGVIEIAIKEDFTNTYADAQIIPEPEPAPLPEEVCIIGPTEVDCADMYKYSIQNAPTNGTWEVNNKLARIVEVKPGTAYVGVTSMKSGKFVLKYTYGEYSTELEITIRSI